MYNKLFNFYQDNPQICCKAVFGYLFRSFVLLLCITNLFISNAEAAGCLDDVSDKSPCILASDFGFKADTIVVKAHPKDADILIKEPKDHQIVKWVDSYLFTTGLAKEAGDKSSKVGVLTGYVSGGWNPWGFKQGNVQCCDVENCNAIPLRQNEKCIGSSDTIGKAVNDALGMVPCALKDGYGLYGLIALENNNTFQDPNDPANFDLDPAFFRTFRLGKLYEVDSNDDDNKKKMKRFQIEYTQVWNENAKQWEVDKKDGVPYIPRGKLYFKIYDSYYQDNYGEYQIYVDNGVYKKQGFIEGIIDTIKRTIKKVTQGIYQSIVKDYGFITIVRTLLVLYITITGFMFAAGLLRIHQSELVIRLFKVAILLILISENSWNFFNGYLFSLFSDGAMEIADRIMSLSMFDEHGQALMPMYDRKDAFSVYDSILTMLGKSQLHLKILSLLFYFADWKGYMIPAIYIAIGFMLLGMLKSMVQYLMALFMLALLFVSAPIFLIMILFKVTNEFFENWLKYLMSNSLLIIVTMAAVGLLLGITLESLMALLSFEICNSSLYNINLLDIHLYWWLPSDRVSFSDSVTLEHFLKLLVSAAVFSLYMDHVPRLVDALSNMARTPLNTMYGAVVGAFQQSAMYEFMMDLRAMNPIGAKIDKRIDKIMDKSQDDGSMKTKVLRGAITAMGYVANADKYVEKALTKFGGNMDIVKEQENRRIDNTPISQLFREKLAEYTKPNKLVGPKKPDVNEKMK